MPNTRSGAAKPAKPSRHTGQNRPVRAKSRRVGPSPTQQETMPPKSRGRRNPAPKRPRQNQPEGHVGRP